MVSKATLLIGIGVIYLIALLPLATSRALSPGEDDGTCGNYFSCSTCAARPGCGWCAYLFECMAGNVNGSKSGTCTQDWTIWMFEPSECPAVSPFPSFCTSKPCSDCIAAEYCGWCDSACVPGTKHSPYYGNCPKWHFDKCPVVLASNVWWIWGMLAFLLLSILITLLGTCLFKPCRALVNGTPVSGEHTPPVYQTKIYMTADSQGISDSEQILLDEE